MRHACRQRCLLGQLVAVRCDAAADKGHVPGGVRLRQWLLRRGRCTRAQLLRTASCVRWGQQPGQNVTFCECAWHCVRLMRVLQEVEGARGPARNV